MRRLFPNINEQSYPDSTIILINNSPKISFQQLRSLERRILFGLLVVCSIPFWPLIMAYFDIHSSYLNEKFNLGFSNSMSNIHNFWLTDLLMNLLGYASIFIPIHFISLYLHKIRYNEISGSGWIARSIKSCLFEATTEIPTTLKHSDYVLKSLDQGYFYNICNPLPGSFGYHFLLLASGLGLQISYLTWGILQERIMTRYYEGETFKDSQFLVFINRLLAGVLAIVILVVNKNFSSSTAPKHAIPFFKYSYSSLSNILSSWCQYEALKFVSFPVQVLAKASKIIPVMLMGKLVRKQTFRWDEYVTAGIISLGVTFFLLDTSSLKSSVNIHPSQSLFGSISGMILLVLYMLFDSFTSNWQDNLFKTYQINPIQMMAGINIWSCFFTVASLIEQGTLLKSISFSILHWDFFEDIFILSLCSAVGQLFIYFTINKFGAVIFIIIMTMRQAIAILLSCAIYGHSVHVSGILGIVLVFFGLFSRIYLSFKFKKINQNI